MQKNKLKEQEPEVIMMHPSEEHSGQKDEQNIQPRRRRKKGILPAFMKFFGIFDQEQVVRYMPFILFLAGIMMVYIANSFYSERTIRAINTMKNEIREKRAEYISTSSELMFRTRQSEVAKAIAPEGIRESTEPRKKVVVNDKN